MFPFPWIWRSLSWGTILLTSIMANPPVFPWASFGLGCQESTSGVTQEPPIPKPQASEATKPSVWQLLGLPEPNPNAPYAQPPELKLLFEDDFSRDTRQDYEIDGRERAVVWEPGRLTLNDGAEFARTIDGENRVELNLDLQFPELTEDGQDSELKIFLDLEPATDSYLLLRQERRDGQIKSTLTVNDLQPPGSPQHLGGQPQTVRSETGEGPLKSGLWKIEFYGGVWSVHCPNATKPILAYLENGPVIIAGSRLSCTGKSVEISCLRASAVPRISVVISDSQGRELQRAAELNGRVFSLWQKGKSAEALPLAQEALAIRLQILGEFHVDIPLSLLNLAAQLEAVGRASDAEPLYEATLTQWRRLFPGDHPKIAVCLNNLAYVRESIGRVIEAEPLYVAALEMRKRLYSGDHAEVARGLNNLAHVRQSLGRGAEAEPLFDEALMMLKRLFPGDHPQVATSLNNLASLHQSLGQVAEAIPLYEEALEMVKRLFREDHPLVARGLNNLADVYCAMGRAAEAEPLYQDALRMHQRLFTGDHPLVAASLNNLAAVRQILGRPSEAEPLYSEGLAMLRRLVPGDHPQVATTLNNLAGILITLDRADEAEPLYEDALAMLRRLFPGDHPTLLRSLEGLAGVRQSQGRNHEAAPLCEDALAMSKRLYQGDHPEVAHSLSCLARAHMALGRESEAEPLCEEALAMRKRLFPSDHPDLANSLFDLAYVRAALGRFPEAELLYSEALSMNSTLLESSALYQSELQQMQMAQNVDNHLQRYVSMVAESDLAPDQVLNQCLRFKGAVMVRQRAMRLARQSNDSQVTATIKELQKVGAQLATLSLAPPTDASQLDSWRQMLTDLDLQRERLEKKLSDVSAEFRKLHQQSNFDLAAILASLPPDGALVEVQRYNRRLESTDEDGPVVEPSFCAFVMRPGRPVKLIQLGPQTSIEELIGLWRQNFGGPAGNEGDPGMKLRKLLWEPLAPELDGITTVLVAPEGMTAMIPWGALPGSQPDSYLLEEYSFVTLPVPQLLPELLQTPTHVEAAAPSLLLVGDVDYGAASGQSERVAMSRSAPVSRTSGSRNWVPLDDTRTEIVTIRDSFEQYFPSSSVKVLRGGGATEGAIRQFAPDHRWLHVATHGYLAPPSMTSALSAGNRRKNAEFGDNLLLDRPIGFHPGVLSGLVLAGANQEPQPNLDDGILTALELAELDLRRVDCAVLSACSTGLGELAGGEGMLGLQRAFQIAGARTTVTSLWEVNSAATRELMIRFYDHLYHPDPARRASHRIEALRRAQLELLRNPQWLRGGTDELAEPRMSKKLSPQFWAAWVLAGDWR